MNKFGLKIDITNQCNLKCQYCYVDKHDMKLVNVSQINTALHMIRENSLLFDKTCTFFGGEPSLAHNLINVVMNDNKDFAFNIISNGYRLFYHNDYNFYKRFNHVTITLEGTERSYNELRGESDLDDRIQQIISLKNSGCKVDVNMSLNGLLLDDLEEFIHNVEQLVTNKICVLLYCIKGDNKFKNTQRYIDFLNKLKVYSHDIYSHILGLNHDISLVDTEYLCTFDSCVTVSSDGKVIGCTMGNQLLGDVSDVNSYKNIFKLVPDHHKSLWKGCSNCEVPVGMCQVSCPAYIRNCYDNNKLNELNHVCEFEKIKEFYRRKELRAIGY